MSWSRRRFVHALAAMPAAEATMGVMPMACVHEPPTHPSSAVASVHFDGVEAIAERLWADTSGDSEGAIPATLAERHHAAALGDAVVRRAAGGEVLGDPVRRRAHDAGFDVQAWSVGGRWWWAIVERERGRGLGAYLFRRGPRGAERYRMVQAPHAFHDRSTGALALHSMMASGEALPHAVFVNTRHRYSDTAVPTHGDPYDVCHHAPHVFNTMLEAVVKAEPAIDVVQLHGFADRSVDERDPDSGPLLAVVSPGAHERSVPWSAAVAGALHDAWGSGVRRYPDQVRALGGRTNVQGRILVAHPHSRFVHIELASSVRGRPAAEVAAQIGAAIVRAADEGAGQ